jgi:hypothetical protein
MIALPPDVEKKLTLLAQEAHTTVAGYLSSLVAHLPEPKSVYVGETSISDAIAAKLDAWQAEDGSELFPDTSVKETFSPALEPRILTRRKPNVSKNMLSGWI